MVYSANYSSVHSMSPVYTGDTSGNIKALVTNHAVRSTVLSDIYVWKKQESATLDALVK